jgi:UPF0042 nucleotide-binding protein
MSLPLVVISGISGAGKTQSVRALESLGYRCTDNLPARLLGAFLADLGAGPAAVVVDARGVDAVDVAGVVRRLRDLDRPHLAIFLDAPDETIARRYSEARKTHPLDRGAGVEAALRAERELLGEMREVAEVIDTGEMRVDALVRTVQERVRAAAGDGDAAGAGPPVRITSFGFKHGLPRTADWVLDVRFLENPFYDARLRPLSGLDAPVRDYVLASPPAGEFVDRVAGLIAGLLRGYAEQGKPELSVCVGCTGGRHRSVVLAEELGRRLQGAGAEVHVRHRDLERGGG